MNGMKGQTFFIVGVIAAILIAVFSVLNVESVPVNLLFVQTDWPLILIILFSVLLGAIVAFALSGIRMHQLKLEMKKLKEQKNAQVDESEEVNTQPNRMKKEHKKD